MPTLQLMRPDEKANQLAQMDVYLNGQLLGSLLNNESKSFEVPAGRHRLKVKTDSQGSKVFKCLLTASETKVLVISTNPEANRPQPLVSGTFLDFIITPLQLLYYFTVGHSRCLTIAELKWK